MERFDKINRDSKISVGGDASVGSRQSKPIQPIHDDELESMMIGNPFSIQREEAKIERQQDFSDFSPIKRSKPEGEIPLQMNKSPTEALKEQLIQQQNEQQRRIDSLKEIN